MTIPIILILAVLWAAFFLWPLMQRRRTGGRNSIGSFARGVAVVSRVGGHFPTRSLAPLTKPVLPAPVVAFGTAAGKAEGLPTSPMAQRRRRDAFMMLGGAVAATLLLAAVSANAIAWAVQLLTDVAFVAYLVALVRIRRRAQERHATVHFLPPAVQPPTLVLHRSASS